MFKRTNFAANYKQYLKFQKSARANLLKNTKALIVDTNGTNSLSYTLKTFVSNIKSSWKHKAVISAIQSKYADSYQTTENNVTNRRNFLKRSLPFSIAGVGAIKAETGSHTGYSSYDFEILKQLGVIGANDNLKSPSETSENVESSTVVSDITKTNTTNNLQTSDNLNLTNNSSTIDYPPSLFDYTSNNASVLDNLPEERNDLYSSLLKTFSSTKEQSTQVESHQLSSDSVEQTEIVNNEADFFIIETPGKEIANNADILANEATNITNESSLVSGERPFSESSNEFNQTFNLDASNSEIIVEPIPEPPAAPDLTEELASTINALGEPTFESLGLGGWTPIGIVQNCFEYFHVTLGIPWWEAIAIGTIIIRFAMFPLVIITQRNAARMNNYLPQMQVLQVKMTEARQTGNQLEAARYSQELWAFMKEKQVNPFKNMLVPFAQMPVFVSFFMGLREMANLPVESLRTGGMLWFTDLTVPDQYFALPIITSMTLWATIEVGTDAGKLSSQNLQTMKYVLRAMPLMIIPFTVNFPGAILCYWVSSNFISLAQVGFLRIPAVRDYFKIEQLVKHDPETLPVKNKGFVGGIKESWTNLKITQELEERRRLDDMQFQRAGKGPLVKTFKYDPTKQGPSSSSKPNAISAKGR